MTKFSQALENYIYKSGLTENQLAKVSGFARSYIALMKNGQRVSSDTIKMNRLLEALSLSPYEYDEIWNAYLLARFGEHIYELRMNMISFIESFGRKSKISIKSEFQHVIPDIKTIDNRMDLEYLVKAVIEKEALKEYGHIQMLIQGDFPMLFSVLADLCRNNKTIKIEHIICFEGCDNEQLKNQSYNLKLFETILPVVLNGNENGYDIYYYYDKVSSHFSNTVLLPYVIITSEYIINISTDLEYAMVSKEADTHKLFAQLFNERKKVCRNLIQRIPTGLNIFEYYKKYNSHGDNVYSIATQPCFSVFDIDKLIEKYISKDHNDILNSIYMVLNKNREIYASLKCLTSYFTKSGIMRLMGKGVIDELPRELYIPIDIEDRKLLLRMLIAAIKNNAYEAYLIDETKLSYPNELIMAAYSFTRVDIIYMSKNKETRFAISEQSIAKNIYDFLEDFKMSTYVYSKEETLYFLENVLVDSNTKSNNV